MLFRSVDIFGIRRFVVIRLGNEELLMSEVRLVAGKKVADVSGKDEPVGHFNLEIRQKSPEGSRGLIGAGMTRSAGTCQTGEMKDVCTEAQTKATPGFHLGFLTCGQSRDIPRDHHHHQPMRALIHQTKRCRADCCALRHNRGAVPGKSQRKQFEFEFWLDYETSTPFLAPFIDHVDTDGVLEAEMATAGRRKGGCSMETNIDLVRCVYVARLRITRPSPCYL